MAAVARPMRERPCMAAVARPMRERPCIAAVARPMRVSLLNRLVSDMRLGRNVARTFLDYYKLNNVIKDHIPTHTPSSETTPPAPGRQGNGRNPGMERGESEKERKN